MEIEIFLLRNKIELLTSKLQLSQVPPQNPILSHHSSLTKSPIFKNESSLTNIIENDFELKESEIDYIVREALSNGSNFTPNTDKFNSPSFEKYDKPLSKYNSPQKLSLRGLEINLLAGRRESLANISGAPTRTSNDATFFDTNPYSFNNYYFSNEEKVLPNSLMSPVVSNNLLCPKLHASIKSTNLLDISILNSIEIPFPLHILSASENKIACLSDYGELCIVTYNPSVSISESFAIPNILNLKWASSTLLILTTNSLILFDPILFRNYATLTLNNPPISIEYSSYCNSAVVLQMDSVLFYDLTTFAKTSISIELQSNFISLNKVGNLLAVSSESGLLTIYDLDHKIPIMGWSAAITKIKSSFGENCVFTWNGEEVVKWSMERVQTEVIRTKLTADLVFPFHDGFIYASEELGYCSWLEYNVWYKNSKIEVVNNMYDY